MKNIRFYTPFNHPIDANSPASINRVDFGLLPLTHVF